jgi:4-amino-4-deoxy-L-arabinose transferase-like glycosyltransferase
VEHSERLWLARLRWRMRGAWLWPAFFGLTAVDGALIALLPPYEGTPRGAIGGVLLAGFANLAVIAVLAPLAGHALRRRRPDLPRVVANDYAGAALLLVLAAGLLAAGLVHRPAEAAERGDEAAVVDAVERYVSTHASRWRPGLDRLDAVQLAPEVYRACVPGADPRRSLCMIVDTDRRPAALTRDDSMEPN